MNNSVSINRECFREYVIYNISPSKGRITKMHNINNSKAKLIRFSRNNISFQKLWNKEGALAYSFSKKDTPCDRDIVNI